MGVGVRDALEPQAARPERVRAAACVRPAAHERDVRQAQELRRQLRPDNVQPILRRRLFGLRVVGAVREI